MVVCGLCGTRNCTDASACIECENPIRTPKMVMGVQGELTHDPEDRGPSRRRVQKTLLVGAWTLKPEKDNIITVTKTDDLTIYTRKTYIDRLKGVRYRYSSSGDKPFGAYYILWEKPCGGFETFTEALQRLGHAPPRVEPIICPHCLMMIPEEDICLNCEKLLPYYYKHQSSTRIR